MHWRNTLGVGVGAVSTFISLSSLYTLLFPPQENQRRHDAICLAKRMGKRREDIIISCCFLLVRSLYLTVGPASSPKADGIQKFQSTQNKTRQNQAQRSLSAFKRAATTKQGNQQSKNNSWGLGRDVDVVEVMVVVVEVVG